MFYKTLTAVILIKILYKFFFVFSNYRRPAVIYAGPLKWSPARNDRGSTD